MKSNEIELERGLQTHNRLRELHKSQKLVLDDELTQNANEYAAHLADNQLWGHATNLKELNQGSGTLIFVNQPRTLRVPLCFIMHVAYRI